MKQNIYSHLEELKKRILISFLSYVIAAITSYVWAEDIYQFLMIPISKNLPDDHIRQFIFTNLSEVFFSYIKLASFSGFIISFPIIISQLYLFCAPALYAKEKKIFLPLIALSTILFLLGVIFVYLVILPFATKFFLSFENINHTIIPIVIQPKVSEYLSLIMSLVIAFGLAFQLPIVLILFSMIGLIDSNWLKKKRKFSIVIIFVVAAIITPPDVVSQVALAIPMLILYELSILACKYIKNLKGTQ